MKLNLWPVLAAGAVLAGCGSESTATSAKPQASSDEERAGDVSLRYIQAVADHDWKAACATRPDSEQREMAKLGGSCEKAFAAIFEGKPTSLFEDVKLADVRVSGTRAEVDLVQPGQSEPAMTLVAKQFGSEWRVIDE